MGEEGGGDLWLKNMMCQPSPKIYQLSEILYPGTVLQEFTEKVLFYIRTK